MATSQQKERGAEVDLQHVRRVGRSSIRCSDDPHFTTMFCWSSKLVSLSPSRYIVCCYVFILVWKAPGKNNNQRCGSGSGGFVFVIVCLRLVQESYTPWMGRRKCTCTAMAPAALLSCFCMGSKARVMIGTLTPPATPCFHHYPSPTSTLHLPTALSSCFFLRLTDLLLNIGRGYDRKCHALRRAAVWISRVTVCPLPTHSSIISNKNKSCLNWTTSRSLARPLLFNLLTLYW